MPLRDYKPVLVICAAFLLVAVAVPVISAYWPRYEELFFELGLLGKDRKAEGYYPNDNPTLETGSSTLWHIYINNHMGRPQDVAVRVKLLNSTMQTPDDRKHEPSPFPHIAEFPASLNADDTTIIPFSWSIFETQLGNGSVTIDQLMVNNRIREVDVSGVLGSRFRLVLELWVYNSSSQEYEFKWDSRGESYSASLYIWFRPLIEICVGGMSMAFTKQGTMKVVQTTVTILDESGYPVSDALVYLNATLPDGSFQTFSGKTDLGGTMQSALRSELNGNYICQVTDVVKEGLTYDPKRSVKISETLVIP